MQSNTFTTLSDVQNDPNLYINNLVLSSKERLVLRPLLTSDVIQLTTFFENLSVETRGLCTFDSYDEKMAQELCDAINKYDKLRLVVESELKEIVGLLEFSFGLPDSDIKRYSSYGIQLHEQTDCRFGPTLIDKYQNKGLGSVIFSHIVNIAKKFGKKRIILLGGVLADNQRAIHYYEKQGFKEVGKFVNEDNIDCLDMILII